jgi:hypothetical protein
MVAGHPMKGLEEAIEAALANTDTETETKKSN